MHTYLQAKALAEAAPALDRNFRSRPGVLRAIQALYDNAGPEAFLDERIQFEPVLPGSKRSDADYLFDGKAAPALTLQLIAGDADGKPLKADASRDAATAACVADIHRVLSAAREGRALVDGMPVQPGDIAVLVRSHKEASRVQQAERVDPAGQPDAVRRDGERGGHEQPGPLPAVERGGRGRGGDRVARAAPIEHCGEPLQGWRHVRHALSSGAMPNSASSRRQRSRWSRPSSGAMCVCGRSRP